MKRHRYIVIIVSLMIVSAMMFGCGRKDDSPEGLIKQMIAAMSDLADQFETIEDAASADAAAGVIERDIAPRLESVIDKLEALEGEIGEDTLEELAELYEEEFEQVFKRFLGEYMRVAMNEELMTPALEEAMSIVEETVDDF